MADVTSIIIEHNFDLNDLTQFDKDFSNRTNTPVFYSHYDDNFNYNPPIPDDFIGWLRVESSSKKELSFKSYFDLWHNGDDNYIDIGLKYAQIGLYKIDYYFEWWHVGLILDRFNKKDLNDDFLTECMKERAYIYQTLKLFGGSKCFMFNGEEHGQFLDDLLNGQTLESLIASYDRKLNIVYFQSLDLNKTYEKSTDWYNTILFDDFSDLK